MREIKERLGDLERKINHDGGRLEVLRRFADLPGVYLALLVQRGALSTPESKISPHWHELALAMKDLDSVKRYLRNCRENILHSCGSVSSSWESMSDRWSPLIQTVESFKDAREVYLEMEKKIQAITEKLPEDFSGIIDDLAASKPTETLVLEGGSKKALEAIEQTQAAIKKLEGELDEMEIERESLVRRLRDNQHRA